MPNLYNKQTYTAIGLMSGTSCDGVDAAVIETDGEGYVKPLGFVSINYPAVFQQQLVQCGKSGQVSAEIIAELMRYHLQAVQKLGVKADVIGLHGHTIAHNPAEKITVQIEDAAWLQAQTNTPVVYDFRTADVQAGGQGAPLVPIYHQAIAPKNSVVINIGGVANLTYYGELLQAFDTGMGNGLIDEYLQQHCNLRYDDKGAIAASGAVQQEVVDKWLQHSYFELAAPKSIDRFDFQLLDDVDSLSVPDAVATLTAFTAQSIAQSMQLLPEKPKQYFVAGGGRYNKTLIRILNELLDNVQPVEALDCNGDAVEAEAFAYLAIRHLKQLPITFPGTTGAKKPLCGGCLFK